LHYCKKGRVSHTTAKEELKKKTKKKKKVKLEKGGGKARIRVDPVGGTAFVSWQTGNVFRG